MCSDRGRGQGGKKKESEHGKWRRDRPISGPKRDNHRSLLFRKPLLSYPCSSFQNSEDKFTTTTADVSEKLLPNYCNQNMLHFLHGGCLALDCGFEWLNITKKLFSQFYLGLSRAKAPLLAEYAISCLNKPLPLAKSKIKTF